MLKKYLLVLLCAIILPFISLANAYLTASTPSCHALSGVAKIHGVSSFTSVSWTYTGDITGPATTTTDSAVVYPSSSTPGTHSGTVTALVHTTCADFTIGPASISFLELAPVPDIDGAAEVCAFTTHNHYTISYSDATGPGYWNITPALPLFTPGYYSSISLYFGAAGSTYILSVALPTVCDSVYQFLTINVIDCEGFRSSTVTAQYTAYPNPANSSFTVALNENIATDSKTTTTANVEKTDKLFEVRILNKNGQVLKSLKNNGKRKMTFDTSDIPYGTYILHIIDGKNTIKKQIIINH
jgi:hypothetical protein